MSKCRWSPSAHRSPALRWAALAVLCACPQLLDDDFALQRPSSTDPVGNPPSGGTSGATWEPPDEPAGASGASGASGAGGSSAESAGAGGGGGSSSGGSAGAAGVAGSGGVDPRSCDFGPAELLTGLGLSASMWGPSLSADGLTLYFSSDAAGSEDLYRATRSDRGTAFGAAQPLDTLNTSAGEGSPYVSADGLTLYFYSSRSGGVGSRDLYSATRASPAAEFNNPELLANVNAAHFDHLPRLSADELTLLFTSTRPTAPGNASLYTATRSSISGNFGTPQLLPGINDDTLNEAGGFSADGLTLYFDSSRVGEGGHDLWRASRETPSAEFGNPTPLSALNTPADEYNVSLSRDELELVFTSDRNSATYRLHRSLRSCP